jgi:threonine aldolase
VTDLVDLRSDTVTRPTPEMRRAMAEAVVGDDVLGDDPTVIDLQEFAADTLGKEAGLFVPTGTMGNQVGLGVLARPGDEVVCDPAAHFLHHEVGGIAAHLGLVARPIGEPGGLTADLVAPALRAGNEHNPRTAAVALENTHNAAGGRVLPIEETRAIAKLAHDRGVAVHLDGARIFNAQVATGVGAREWAECANTITFCFSKGLGAPIGSMVCGSAEAVAAGRRLRKRLGGGMRQVGVIAAAARVALATGVERLAEDHANARRLAEGLADLAPGACDPERVETNMVYLDLGPFGKTAPEVSDALRSEGVLTLGPPGSIMRLVTHRDVDAAGVGRALRSLRRHLLN